MQTPPNNLLSVLEAGLMDGVIATPHGTPLVDLDQWAQDPEHRSLLMATIIKNSLKKVMPFDIEEHMQGKTLPELFKRFIVADYGRMFVSDLYKFFDKVDWIGDGDMKKHMQWLATSCGMEFNVNNKRYLVFMRLPCELGCARLEKYDTFHTLTVQLIKDGQEWVNGRQFNPEKPYAR